MNIFVTSSSPRISAFDLPDKHIVKMPLECCQMLSIVASKKWGNDYGVLEKKDGSVYLTEKGGFRNHPCTVWVRENQNNAYWLINHGLYLCEEYSFRYGKTHSCEYTLNQALKIFPKGDINKTTEFVRAMPDELKFDFSINTYEAYQKYISSKPWTHTNYLRKPERKPKWLK